METHALPAAGGRRKAVDELIASGGSCVVLKDGVCHSFHRRGVADLYHLLKNDPALLDGAFVADKVVGKGAAALMCLGGVSAVWSRVMSRSALRLFTRSGVEATYETLTDHIINRAGTGICPVEQLCSEADTPEECLPLIEKFLESIAKNVSGNN